jgi:methylated-DNA-[protein]-cysteine S-methyltransferase
MNEKYIYFYETQVGKISVTEEDGAVTGLFFGVKEKPLNSELKETALLKAVKLQLDEYFNKKRQVFNLPLKLEGTVFQKRVWQELLKIPYGETRSYGEIARALNIPKGARAVGLANNKNPVSIIVPCHRVIGSDGKLVGYGGGLPVKEALLRLESIL